MIEKSILDFKNYGQCIRLSNGVIEAIATVDIGPRIISFGFIGKENIMNSQKDKFEPVSGESFDRHFYKGATWHNYGGHRLWFSPEKLPDTYYPDCEPVTYEFTDTGVILTPPPQISNDVSMQMILTMDPEQPSMQVLHKMTNVSGEAKDLALWALSACEQNGTLIIPMNKNNTGLLHNRIMSVWPYTDLSDSRLFFGKRYVTLRQDPAATCAVKVGFDLNQGVLYYVLGDSVLKKQFKTNHTNGRYPDGGVSMETYTCALFTEMETLSELKMMQPGATETHLESWTMLEKPCDFDCRSNDSIDNFVKQL